MSPRNLDMQIEFLRSKWVFPKIGVPQNGWFIIENLIKMYDLGVPPFKETPKCLSLRIQDVRRKGMKALSNPMTDPRSKGVDRILRVC